MATELLKDLTKDKVKFYLVISFSLISLIAYLLLMRLDLGRLSSIRREREEKKGNLAILDTITEYKDYVNKFNGEFTVSAPESKIMDMIATLAERNHVKLDMVKPIDSRQTGGYGILRILTEGSAPYRDIVNFIIELEGGDDYFIVSSFDLAGRETDVVYGKKERQPSSPSRIGAFKLTITCFNLEHS